VRVLLINDGHEARTAHANDSAARRLGYVACAPAIPCSLPRVRRNAGRTMRCPSVAASLPSILLHLTVHGSGEAAAYLTRRAGDVDLLASHEFSHRPEPAARV
jgi:hypothetical protein